MYDQMEQNLIDLSQGKGSLLSIESLLSAGQGLYGGGEVSLSSQLKNEQHYSGEMVLFQK